MISTRNLTPKDLVEIAKQMVEKGNNKDTKTVAVLVTTSEYVKDEGEKVISQAIIPCVEVDC